VVTSCREISNFISKAIVVISNAVLDDTSTSSDETMGFYSHHLNGILCLSKTTYPTILAHQLLRSRNNIHSISTADRIPLNTMLDCTSLLPSDIVMPHQQHLINRNNHYSIPTPSKALNTHSSQRRRTSQRTKTEGSTCVVAQFALAPEVSMACLLLPA
jgi:hypothetical protein